VKETTMNIIHRNYLVDFLRGIAILLVMILHFHLAYHLENSALNKIFAVNFIKSVANNGNYGVTIFFVISGFLITLTSLERYGELRKIDVFSFYVFRFSRIMPCLILALSIIVLFNFFHVSIFQNNTGSVSMFVSIFSIMTFWHNVLMSKIGYFNYCLNILWSLSVEEVFYLVFPLVCLFFKKERFIFLFWCALIIAAPIYRHHFNADEIVALYGYLSCFDAIALGCIAAVIAQRIHLFQWQRKVLLISSGILMIAVYLYDGIMQNVVIGVSVMAVGAAIFLMCASCSELTNNNAGNLCSKAVCWFGKNSYELYLFHIIVLALMKTLLSADNLNNYTKLLWMLLFLSASSLVAAVVSRFYSQPMNKKWRTSLILLQRMKENNLSTGDQA
jgi:peptidoglycan/LPS O-acetylase OafA/YrhL